VANAAFSEIEYHDTFSQWLSDHNKIYTAEEFQNRFNIFKSNMDFVEQWNAQGSTTEVELNKFADLSNEEFRRIYLGYRQEHEVVGPRSPVSPAGRVAVKLPASVDWRLNGSVTPVKDQGQCGGCWAFSATGSTEAAHKIKTGNLVSLSEQDLIDCSTKEGNGGCNGGLMDDAFKYIIANKGIDTEASYPFTGKNGKCEFKSANIGATLTSYKNVKKDSEEELQDAIATHGPVSVAIDASHNSFQLYKKGVYYESACSSTKLDHGVLAVGYGSDAGVDYWLVKNSWGPDWGQEGYIWMSRDKKNNCGIATSASYPIA